MRIGILVRFGHLFLRLLEAHDLLSDFADVCFRNREDITVNLVESFCNISGDLQMLRLIFPHRYHIGLKQQNICRHQYRVSEKSCVDIFRMLLRLIFKLGHPVHFPHIGKAV